MGHPTPQITRVGVLGLCALLLTSQAKAQDDLFRETFVSDGGAAIRIDATRRGAPISRRLFGKFTEHLHRNIYHGMWAQTVRNPGFEDWKFFFSNDEALRGARKRAADAGRPWPEGLAAHWLPVGKGEIHYRLDPECINSQAAQHVRIRSLRTAEAGIRQDGVYLPLHRESDYLLRVYLRSHGVDTVAVTLRHEERMLARIRIAGLDEKWKLYERRLRIGTGVDRGAPLTLTVTADRPGEFWIDQLVVFPADNVHGFDRDVVEFCRRARLSLLRYPGGNFVSGYHWRDGIGPVDTRPMRRNPAWNCPEYNHVGTDEFLAFCEVVGCEPLICINAGDGTPAEAAQWVEYCNGPIESQFGRLRARHGHPRPYKVRYWEIGNEIYGSWQVGHCSAQEYAVRYRRFVEAMREVDSSIRFIANGRDAAWHAPLLESHPTLVRSFSVHPLIGSRIPRETDPAAAYRALVAYPSWYGGHLRRLGEQMTAAGVTPRLAVTELQIFTNKDPLPTNSTLAEAVFMARYFHMAIRLGGLVEMITHSALVNHGGGLRKQRGIVFATPSWWATHLYGTMDGTIPVAVDVRTPAYAASVPSVPSIDQAPVIDAIALTDAERSVLTVMLINTHADRSVPVTLSLQGWPAPEHVRGRQLRGPSFMTRNAWDAPDRVSIHPLAGPANMSRDSMQMTLPPHSVTELVLPR